MDLTHEPDIQAVLAAVLCHQDGPAADALRRSGFEPEYIRSVLTREQTTFLLADPPLWPTVHQELLDTEASEAEQGLAADGLFGGYSWTSPGQELQLFAAKGGPIFLKVEGDDRKVRMTAEAAEIIGHRLLDYCYQVQAEQWEPIWRNQPRPPRRTPRAAEHPISSDGSGPIDWMDDQGGTGEIGS